MNIHERRPLRKDSVKAALVLASIFGASFIIALSLISYAAPTWKNYSIPSSGGGTDVYWLGPAPNSSNVSLNTAIIVYEFRPINVNGMHLTPSASLSEITQSWGLASLHTSFVPAEPLKPDTLYNVSAYIMGKPVSWSFTTTSSNAGFIGFLEYNQEALYTSLAAAIAVTAAAALKIKATSRKRRARKVPKITMEASKISNTGDAAGVQS